LTLTFASVTPTAVDALAFLIIAADAYIGYRRGLSGELIRLISMLLAVAAGIFLLKPLGSFCFYHARAVETESDAYTLAFIAAVAAASMVRLLIQPVLHNWFDKHSHLLPHRRMGALAGTVHAMIGISVVVVMMNLWLPTGVKRVFGPRSLVSLGVNHAIPAVKTRLSARGAPAGPAEQPSAQPKTQRSGERRSAVDALREQKRTAGGL